MSTKIKIPVTLELSQAFAAKLQRAIGDGDANAQLVDWLVRGFQQARSPKSKCQKKPITALRKSVIKYQEILDLLERGDTAEALFWFRRACWATSTGIERREQARVSQNNP